MSIDILDGDTVVGSGALQGVVQVFPAEFGSVNIVFGQQVQDAQPSQDGQTKTFSQSVTDPETGITTTLTLTEAAGDSPDGYLLVTALKNFVPPPTPGVVEFLNSYDVRQHNLPADASAVVTVTFPTASPPDTTPKLFYLDTRTDPSHPTEKLVQGPPQFNGQTVSFVLNPFSTPRLKELNGTVFTVSATVPGQTTTTTVSSLVASNAMEFFVPSQTGIFQSTSQLTLTLEASEANQVSSGLAKFEVDGGGGDEVVSAAEVLVKYLLNELEFLPQLWLPHNAANASPAVSQPAAPPAAPMTPPAPGETDKSQENMSALDSFLRDPMPYFDWFAPTAPMIDTAGGSPPPRRERGNVDAPANQTKLYTAAAVGAGLYISGREKRRKTRPFDGTA